MDINVRGTLNVLQACRTSRIERMIYSSSAAVYGEARYLPIDEGHPVSPESPYGVSKLAAERYCMAFHRVYGTPTVGLRYFNVYGPRQGGSAYPNVISVFFDRVRGGKGLTIYGDGEQTRDFVFVGDIARANVLAAVSPNAVGGVFNIAGGGETSVNEVSRLTLLIAKAKSEVVYAAPRIGEVKRSLASIESARAVLAYSPVTALKQGMALTWSEE
jgi:UDP-glucose 4-epimerase